MPCCTFWPVEEKQAYVDSTHLNNSDKLSRIIYGADKIQNHLLTNYHFDLTLPCWKKTIEPHPKHNIKCNGCNGYNGNCIGFNGNYNGVYWCVMDSIGEMLNHIGQMPKTHYKNELCNGFTGKKLMVYNVILMETIGISVMDSIVFFSKVFFI